MTGEEGDATAVAVATADEVELDEEGNVVERDANGKKISLVEKQVEALGHTWALDHAENSSGPMLREYYAALKRPQPVESRYNTIAPPPSTQALFDAVALRSRAANKLAYLQLIKMRDGSYGEGNGIEPGSKLRRSLKLCESMLGEKTQVSLLIGKVDRRLVRTDTTWRSCCLHSRRRRDE